MTGPVPSTRRVSAADRRFLETLVFLRALYAHRGARDRTPVLPLRVLVPKAPHDRRMAR